MRSTSKKPPTSLTKLASRSHIHTCKFLALAKLIQKNLFCFRLWTTQMTSHFHLPIGTNGESLDFWTNLFTEPSVSYSWNDFRSGILASFEFQFKHQIYYISSLWIDFNITAFFRYYCFHKWFWLFTADNLYERKIP